MKLFLYIIRWQLSTPILYVVMNSLDLPELQKVIIANFVGALIFFPIDKHIFNNKKAGKLKQKLHKIFKK